MTSYQSLPRYTGENTDVDLEYQYAANADDHWANMEAGTAMNPGAATGTFKKPSFSIVSARSYDNAATAPTSTFEGMQSKPHVDNQSPRKKRFWTGSWTHIHGRKKRHFWTDSWVPEILGLLVSWAALSGSVYLFVVATNDYYTSYWNSRLSPTAIVAILAKAAQVGLAVVVASCVGQLGWMHFVERRKQGRGMRTLGRLKRETPSHRLVDLEHFNQASRSPLGAMLLLFATPSSTSFLCFMIIFAGLGFEAALQQCLTVVVPQYVPRAYDLTGHGQPSLTSGNRFGQKNMTDFVPMTTRAIDALGSLEGFGAYSPPLSLRYTPFSSSDHCRGPGCNPPPYATLGFCPSCRDFTLQPVSDDNDAFMLPDGSTASIDDGVTTSFIPMAVQRNSNHSMPGTLTLADMIVLAQMDLTVFDILDRSTATMAAQRCQIELCVQMYSLQQYGTNGPIITEVPLGNSTQVSKVNAHGAPYGATWAIEVPENIRLTPDLEQTPYAKRANPKDIIPKGDRTKYSIDNTAFNLLCDYFYGLFNGTLEGTFPQASNVSMWSLESLFLEAFTAQYSHQVINRTRSQALQNSLACACKAMETFLRDSYPSQLIDALSIEDDMYRIRWAWIALPAAVEILATILLITVMAKSQRAKLPLWKTNVLAVVLRSGIQVDEKEWKELGSPRTGDLNKTAKEICAELRLTDSGYLLVKSRVE